MTVGKKKNEKEKKKKKWVCDLCPKEPILGIGGTFPKIIKKL